MIRNKNAPATPAINSVLVPVVLGAGVTAPAWTDGFTAELTLAANGTKPLRKLVMLERVDDVDEGVALAPEVFGARFATEDIAGLVGFRNENRSVLFM